MTSCRQRRRSVDIRKPAFAQTSQAFAFAGRQISRCRAAVTPEQEKAALDRLRPLQRWVASARRPRQRRVGALMRSAPCPICALGYLEEAAYFSQSLPQPLAAGGLRDPRVACCGSGKEENRRRGSPAARLSSSKG